MTPVPIHAILLIVSPLVLLYLHPGQNTSAAVAAQQGGLTCKPLRKAGLNENKTCQAGAVYAMINTLLNWDAR